MGIATLVLLLLVLFWIFGYITVPGVSLRKVLFTVRGRSVTIWDALLLLVVLWTISILPASLQSIAAVLLVVWLLALGGIVSVSGLPGIVILIIILVLLFSLLR